MGYHMLNILKAFVETPPFFATPAAQELEAARQLGHHETAVVVGAPVVQNEPESD